MTTTINTGTDRAYKRKRVRRLRKPRRSTRYDRYQDKVIKKLAKDMAPETKVFHTNINQVEVPILGQISVCTSMGQGVDYGQRVGLAQRHKSYRARYKFQNDSEGGGNYVRLILFTWHDEQQPNVASILAAPDNNIASVYNIIPKKRPYRILFDETYYLGTDPSTDTPSYIFPEIYLKLQNKAYYDNSTNADFTTGHLYELLISTSANVEYAKDASYTYTDD